MTRWSLAFSLEVGAWLASLDDDDFGRVACYLDLLGERHGRLAEPHSRPLQGRLRQLEVPGRRTWRLTYYLGPDQTVVLLTVWRRWRPARQEIKRAAAALRRQPGRSRTERSCDGSTRPLG